MTKRLLLTLLSSNSPKHQASHLSVWLRLFEGLNLWSVNFALSQIPLTTFFNTDLFLKVIVGCFIKVEMWDICPNLPTHERLVFLPFHLFHFLQLLSLLHHFLFFQRPLQQNEFRTNQQQITAANSSYDKWENTSKDFDLIIVKAHNIHTQIINICSVSSVRHVYVLRHHHSACLTFSSACDRLLERFDETTPWRSFSLCSTQHPNLPKDQKPVIVLRGQILGHRSRWFVSHRQIDWLAHRWMNRPR